jgi:hypothetical protein
MARFLRAVVLAALAVAPPFVACGSDDAKKRQPDESGGEAGEPPTLAGGEGGNPAGGEGEKPAGGESGNPAGGESGAAGAPVSLPSCADTCVEGTCVLEQCVPDTIIASDVNLATTPVTEGRGCAEAPQYSVTALGPNAVTLQTVVPEGCLVAGDELLLINLQGTPAETANVGNWELVRAESVDDNVVTLSAAKTRFYGASAGSDANIGLVAGTQRVALVRVPQFARLTVGQGASVTAAAWDGQLGGVIALRAETLSLAGRIDARELGYRPGRWSDDDDSCSDSVATEAGESISGLGSATTLRNGGGSGGLTAGSASFQFNNPVLATPGHAQAGQAGTNGNTRTIGQPGLAYGGNDATRLTLGSGPGGALRCSRPPGSAATLSAAGGQAGGIVLLLVNELSIDATGSIDATPPDAQRDIAFAGGYVLIRGESLELGSGRVRALGSVGHGANGLAFENSASPGYVVLDAPVVSGTSAPAATLLQ